MLLLGALALAGCGPAELEKESSKKKSKYSRGAKPVLVELAEVTRGPIEKILERSAPLEAEAQVEVHARTSNPAVDLLVEEGDKVEKGQVLLRLENDRQKNDYDQAKSQLDKEQIDFARQEADRCGRTSPLAIGYSLEGMGQSALSADEAISRTRALEALGVSWVGVGFPASSRAEYCEKIERFGRQVIQPHLAESGGGQ